MKTEIYEFGTWCDNCDQKVALEIPKGTNAKKFMEIAKCPYCGCDVKNTTV